MITVAEPKKFSAAEATAVANEIADVLIEGCERVQIAGSLRRRKPFVKDIEIIYVPKFRRVKGGDLFDKTELRNQADRWINLLVRTGLMARRFNVNGREAWGDKNKLALHVPSGIPVDLFSTTHENFFNYLVCRTGGVENNVLICQSAIDKGWKWNPYGSGFSRDGDKLVHVCNSEREVFEFVGLTYLEPWER